MHKETLLETILNDSTQIVQVSDTETFSMMYANLPAQHFLKHSEKAYPGEHCYKYLMGLDEQCPFCPLRNIEGKTSNETVIDNGKQTFAVKTKLIDWDGKKAFIEYINDITDIKKSQAIYESQIQTLIRSIPTALGIFHMDVTGDVCLGFGGKAENCKKDFYSYRINDVIEDISYFMTDECVRDDFRRKFNRSALMNAYESGHVQLDKEARAVLDDSGGEVRYTRVTARLMLNPSTEHLECVIYGIDINDEIQEKYRYEAYIKEQLDIFNVLVKDFLNIFLINPADGFAKILKLKGYVTTGFDDAKRTSYNYYDFCMQYIKERVHPEDADMMVNAMKLETVLNELNKNGEYVSSYRVLANGETHYYQFKYIRLENSKHIIAGFQNIDTLIANEKKQYEMLSEALAAAERSNRAKTTFLNSISHDIRTPLNAIIGFTALASSHIDNKESVKDYLAKITTSGNHLLSLINDVLDMSHIESGKISIDEAPVHLPELLNELRMIILPNVTTKQLNLFIDAQNVTDEDIITDKLRLNQVLLNILSNAVKFTKTGGSVRFSVVELPGAPEGFADFEFHINDTGIGMSDEFRKHIFEAFTREQTVTISGIQGTGLGMSISKSIVDMMGGSITVKSELGKGSEFTVSLRFRTCGSGTHADLIIPELKEQRVLIADDDFSACEGTAKMLESMGTRPEYVMTGEDALLRIRTAVEQNSGFSAYIIDWMMPDMNGIELARKIRSIIGINVPIIILTAYDSTEIEEEAREAGVTAFCTKPIFISELYRVLSKPYLTASESDNDANSREKFAGKKILLAEDNELNSEIAVAILSDAGFVVDTANDGDVAVEKIINAQPGQYDLILMDVQMPKMNGYEATKRIRALENPELANIPIVAMTANAFEEDRQNALNAGMNAHVAKPIDISKLFATIEEFF